MADLTISFNLTYLGTVPKTVTLLLKSFFIVRKFLWLYFVDLNHHLYHYYRIVKRYFLGFFPQLVYMPLHLIIVDPLNDSTATLFGSSVRSQTFTSLSMESPRITVTSLDFLNFFYFISFLLLIFLLPLLLLFDISLFGLSGFLSFLGVAMFSRNDLVSFLVHDCSCKSMVKESGCKSEKFSLGKTKNLSKVVKSCVLLLIFFCKTFLGNMSFCFFLLF